MKVLNESIKGRVVLIMDTCYSGKLILEAMEQEVDPEKFSIISTTDANNPGYSWPGLYIEGEDWKLKIFSAYGWVANDIREDNFFFVIGFCCLTRFVGTDTATAT